jgi:hypothetical protein
MSSIDREKIALQQVYAALLIAYHGATEPFSSLVARARKGGLLTSASYALLAQASMYVARTRRSAAESCVEEGEGTTASSAALAGLASRILDSLPLVNLPWLTAPPILNPWATLPEAFAAMREGGGFCVLRGDDGYCVLLSHSSVAVWMMQTMGRGDSDDVEPLQVAAMGPDDWSAVDAMVTLSEARRILEEETPRISAILVYRNEDYSGDPIALITPALLSQWQHGLERYRRQAAELLDEASDDDLYLPLEDETAADRLAIELTHAPVSDEVLARAILMSIALSGRGFTPLELVAFLGGHPTVGLGRRHLLGTPLFGCVPDGSPSVLMNCLAGLVERDLLVVSPHSSSYLLAPCAVEAVLQDAPTSGFTAIDALIHEGVVSHGC